MLPSVPVIPTNVEELFLKTVSADHTDGQVDRFENSKVRKAVSPAQIEELPKISLISVDEVVKSLSEFDFDHAKMNPSSSIIPDSTVEKERFHAEEDLNLDSLPNSPNGEKIVEK